MLGRHLLQQRAWPDPSTPTRTLDLQRRFEPDPVRRREAALLQVAAGDAQQTDGDAAGTGRLLRNQAWGRDPLAAVVLKRAAQAAARQEDALGSERLWEQLLARFPDDPASADALYALGRDQPELRRRLLEQFPAHPAALAAAVEAGPAGARHLARWGPRWPGAKPVMLAACPGPLTKKEDDTASTTAEPADSPDPKAPAADPAQSNLLAQGLARLGDGEAALACLGTAPATAATQLELARILLRQGGTSEDAEQRLLDLARQHPRSAEASEAVRLLADSGTPSSLERLAELPEALQDTAPVQARRALVQEQSSAALAVMRRWPKDPASWELQWQLARERLLRQDWRGAAVLLGTRSIDASAMAAPLDARRRFWLALSQWQQGERPQAKAGWADLLARHPQGYYGWRAALRLGRGDLNLDPLTAPALQPPSWRPLASGREDLDRLWRLGQNLEAWEHWRHLRRDEAIAGPSRLLLEGRLRRAVGDHWTGLGQLEQASLELPGTACAPMEELTASLAEPTFTEELNAAGRQARVPAPLLAAVAKQESRFSPTVRSPVGAVGLLQLMPATAAEVAGRPLDGKALEDPGQNAALGARYLRQLMDRWNSDPILVTASYNAGPGAVEGWINPQLQALPELWVESIPYPETRLYVKKVLGNAWNFQEPRQPLCT